MMNKHATNDDIIQALTYMQEMFPQPRMELSYTTPFQLLIAVVLSAQTTDKQVNRATQKLFAMIVTPGDCALWTLDEIRASIATIGMNRVKSGYVQAAGQYLCDHYTAHDDVLSVLESIEQPYRDRAYALYEQRGYLIPPTLQLLQQVPGAGIKTAKVVLHQLYGYPYIAVDTHVHRVANRLGRVSTTSPAKTDQLLEASIPQNYLDSAHHTLILFGRYHCTAKKPACTSCRLVSICLHYQQTVRPATK